MGIFKLLTMASPRRIIAMYGISILSFACLYSLWRGDFYEPYIKFEPASRNSNSRLAMVIGSAIGAEFDAAPDLGQGVTYQFMTGVHTFSEQEGVLVGNAEFYISLQGIENPLFTLNVPLRVSPGSPKLIPTKPGYVLPPGDPMKKIPGFDGEARFAYIGADPLSIEDKSTLSHNGSDVRQVSEQLAKNLARVNLNPKHVVEAFEVICAEQGQPCSRLDNFLRMIYFSAVTITTVGYGDIVPLSHVARLLAAIEATSGIILLGLLLNSIVSAVGRSASSP
jgi:hypothetical protein